MRAFRFAGFLLVAWLLALPVAAPAQVASPHAIDIPLWFTESFLDFKDEAAEAAKSGKRLMLYFGQDGCPYCAELMQTNFSQKDIVEKTRRHFVAIALNIWGDREVTWTDGRTMNEKAFAKLLKVQFTPTLLFLDGDGTVVARLNGYQPPHRFSAALDYVAGRKEKTETLADYLKTHVKEAASDKLNAEPFFLKPPHDLRRTAGGKPLAVLFESRFCQPCDEMHREGFQRAELQAELKKFDVARFALNDRSELVTPAGDRVQAQAWARDLKIAFTPTIVFFDTANREVFRVDGYTRPFHLTTAFEYVSRGGYKTEPQFQRFVQQRADRLRAQGKPVDLWR